MGELVASALAQEGVSRVSSYFSTQIDDKASRAEIIARLEMALSRLAFVLERTGKLPIVYFSLLQRRKILKGAYIEGTCLLNNHKLGLLEGHEETGRVVVRRSSYLQWIPSSIANISISSLLGLNSEHYLSSSVARKFEWYADCADKFVTDLESVCPLRRDTFFRCPFARQLFEGKPFRYSRTKGSQVLSFGLFPMILEGRGIETYMWYNYFDPERLDKSLEFSMILWLSESTDIAGIAMNCLRSSMSLLNLVAEDAMGELTLLSNLQEISCPFDPLILFRSRQLLAFVALLSRSDPVCCHANVQNKPGRVTDIVSSDLSQIFPEQASFIYLSGYIPAEEHSLAGTSDEAGRTRNVMMIDRSPPLQLELFLKPHYSPESMLGECYISRRVGGNKEADKSPYGYIEQIIDAGNKEADKTPYGYFQRIIDTCNKEAEKSPYGYIEQTIGTVRSEAINCLIRQPGVTNYTGHWFSNHGEAMFRMKKARTDDMSVVSNGSGRYKTRSSAKRKR